METSSRTGFGERRGLPLAHGRTRAAPGRVARAGASWDTLHSSATVVAVGLAVLLTAPAGAQIAPDSPRLLNVHAPEGLGIYWLQASALAGDGDAVLFTWDAPGLDSHLRLRGGIGEGFAGTTAVFGAIDRSMPISTVGSSGVDVSWNTGIGVSGGEFLMITVPLGLSLAGDFQEGNLWLSPHGGVGLALDLRLGDDAPEDEFEVEPAVDLGLDLAFDARRSFVVRIAASFADRGALALGVLLPGFGS